MNSNPEVLTLHCIHLLLSDGVKLSYREGTEPGSPVLSDPPLALVASCTELWGGISKGEGE